MYVCMSTPNQAGALASQGHNATAEPTPVMQPDVPKLTPNTRLSTVEHFFEERLFRHTNQVRTVESAERRANDEPARRAEPLFLPTKYGGVLAERFWLQHRAI